MCCSASSSVCCALKPTRCVLQCVAVYDSMLQCVATFCCVFRCDAVCCSMLQCVAICCSMMQYVALCYRASSSVCCASKPNRSVAACCSVLQCVVLQHVAVWCSVLRCVAVCCIVLQREFFRVLRVEAKQVCVAVCSSYSLLVSRVKKSCSYSKSFRIRAGPS